MKLKKHQYHYFIFFWFLMQSISFSLEPEINSNTTRDIQINDTGYFDGNRIYTDMENNGMFVSHRITGHSGMEWPYGMYTFVNFASGVWVSGLVNGEIRTAVAEYGPEFVPGPYGGDPNEAIHKLYKVNLYDLENPSANSDFQNWPTDFGAPWVDVDGDGVYTPLPNGPDHPKFIGDQVLWYVANDGDPASHAIFGTLPLGTETQTTIWGYDRLDPLGDMMFVKQLIINKGTDTIEDAYIGLWADPDLGDPGDDFVGCDTLLGMGFCYNDGEDWDFSNSGLNVPAIGYDFFQGPIIPSTGDTAYAFGEYIQDFKNLKMTSFSKYFNTSDPDWSDPNNAIEVYNLMQGLKKDGTPFINSETGEITTFVYPDDPNLNTGYGDGVWVDGDDHASGDRRFLMNAGPFTMAPGDSQEVIFAIIIGQGVSALESVTRLKEVDQFAQDIADNHYELPNDTTHVIFSLAGNFQILSDNLNGDGQANNGELIKLGFDITNIYIDSASFMIVPSIMTSGVMGEDIQGIVIENIPHLPSPGSTYTVSGDEAPLIFLSPGFDQDYIDIRIDILDIGSGMWDYHELTLPATILDYNPSDSVLWVDHITGDAEGKVGIWVVNPSELTGNDYTVSFTSSFIFQNDTIDGLGISLYDETTGEALLTQHTLPEEYLFDFPAIDGFKLVVEDAPADLKSISVVSNAGGELNPPVDAVASWFFPDYLVADGNYDNQQVTTDATWFYNIGPQYGIDQEAMLSGMFMYSGGYGVSGGLQNIMPDAFEVRFTGNGLAINYWADESIITVPFEWWNIGDVDNPNDDYKLISYVLDEDGNNEWNLQFGSEEADHGTSGGLNDPWTDRVYVLSPVNDDPGTVGYDAFMAAATPGYLPLWYSGPGDNDPGGPLDAWHFLARQVFMLWNGGDVTTATSPSDYTAETPEIGTIFRILTNSIFDTLDIYQFTTANLAMNENIDIPNTYSLQQNYPNPFNPITKITYRLPKEVSVELVVYNLLGRHVRTLVNRVETQGVKTMIWDGKDQLGRSVSSGVYFYRIKAGSFNKTKKMILLK